MNYRVLRALYRYRQWGLLLLPAVFGAQALPVLAICALYFWYMDRPEPVFAHGQTENSVKSCLPSWIYLAHTVREFDLVPMEVHSTSELLNQRRLIIATSPDRRYQLLTGTRYRNLFIYDTQSDRTTVLHRDVPYAVNDPVVFVDNNTFYIDIGRRVDFYDAATGECTPLLEMPFGDKQGDNELLGFGFDRHNMRFAALYHHEETTKTIGYHYKAALFNRQGKILDDFETGIELVKHWEQIVHPMLFLDGDLLTVSSKQFTADYLVTFFLQTTAHQDKAHH